MTILLKIKNGSSEIRKSAMKELTVKSTLYGAEILFQKMLPMIKDSSLDIMERHLLMKALDRVIFKL